MFWNKEEINMLNTTVVSAEPKLTWVQGYKAMDKDMKCRDFQYEIGKTNAYEGKVSLCESGFHFCKDLEDVFGYYRLDFKNRFFKVMGLTNEREQSELRRRGTNLFTSTSDSKLSAKEIVILEELKYEDLKNYISDKYSFVENEAEYNECVAGSYEAFSRNKYMSEMDSMGFKEVFTTALFDELLDKRKRMLLQTIKAYASEKISRDMLIFLIVRESERLKK